MTEWLDIARRYLGTEEVAGGASNPTILGFVATISARFPEQAAYAGNYKNDDTAWCGLFAADCMAETGRRPPYIKGDDLKSFLWANAWQSYGAASEAKVGAIACFDRHVGFVDAVEGNFVQVIGGNQSSPGGGAVTRTKRKISDVVAFRWPPEPAAATAPAPQPTVPAPAGRFTNITATYFNDKQFAYADVDPNKPGVALPFKFQGARPQVRVFYQGRSIIADVMDVGPWNGGGDEGKYNDPYWQTGKRPQAETGTDLRGRPTNKAGIDLNVAAKNALGFSGKDPVDWEFVTEEAPVAVTPIAPIVVQPMDLAPLLQRFGPVLVQVIMFVLLSETMTPEQRAQAKQKLILDLITGLFAPGATIAPAPTVPAVVTPPPVQQAPQIGDVFGGLIGPLLGGLFTSGAAPAASIGANIGMQLLNGLFQAMAANQRR